MAHKNQAQAPVHAVPEVHHEVPHTVPPTQTVVAVVPSAQGRAIVLPNGERRVDYIKRRFNEGASRGAIAKELGVVYQIVFAATKNLKHSAPEGAAAAEVATEAEISGAEIPADAAPAETSDPEAA
jgi:hypothetical protein